MAAITCLDCGNGVPTDAFRCPKCGRYMNQWGSKFYDYLILAVQAFAVVAAAATVVWVIWRIAFVN